MWDEGQTQLQGAVRTVRAACAAVTGGLSPAPPTPGLEGWPLHTSGSLLSLHICAMDGVGRSSHSLDSMG